MRPRRLPRILFLLAIALAAGSAAVAQQPRSPFDLDDAIARNLAPGQRPSRLVETLRWLFTHFDIDGDGVISTADRERSRQHFETAARARWVSEILRADLDGDGDVTREELTRYRTYFVKLAFRGDSPEVEAKRQQQIALGVEIMMRADRNGDGRLEWSEIIAHVKANVTLRESYDPVYQALLEFDADGDGETTMAEFEEALERRFAAVDEDGDGVISRAEFEAYWQRLGRPAPKVTEIEPTVEDKRAQACKLPAAPRGTTVVLFNGGGGLGISTVAIGSQDEITTASRVTIESGREPLYLVLISLDRIIWQFDGAVDRVKRVVLAAMADATDKTMPLAAAGLPAGAITFGSSGECVDDWSTIANGRDDARARQTLRQLVGREPDMIKHAYDVWNLRLPSGEVAEPTDAERQDTFPIDNPTAIGFLEVRNDLFSFAPGGVVRIDPRTVIANLPAESYEVLPEAAGLLQLMLEGALERHRGGEFVIRKPIRFPPGLCVRRAVKFVLAKGVLDPTGDSGGCLVVSEETGRVLCFGAHCKERGN